MAAALRRVRGVISVRVDRDADEALVVRRRGSAPDEALVRAVADAGYRARPIPMEVARLVVEGAEGAGGPERVRAALGRVAGVREVAVEGGRARVLLDRRRTDAQALVRAVRRAGFEAHAEP